ncbi:MAG: 3-phosphoshikimate 1-carboxyvinyltransferase [Sedimentisphaerales bacterium]|nr:3-phosphoshikimate 1-carboxyvinyltransferase [Sedimentisphaerales bacterium]
MQLYVEKSSLQGEVSIPGSKSHTIRAIAIASLAQGVSRIRNPLPSNDTLSAVQCFRLLGAQIETRNNSVWEVEGINGRIQIPDKVIDVGNSGTTLRVALGSAALCNPKAKVVFTGDGQIQARPVGPLLQSLRDLGAGAESLKGNNCAPVAVSGTLIGGKTRIECKTSQYLSSLLLACPLTQKDTEIEVTLLHEPDYVQITLDWLDRQGIRYDNNEMKYFRIPGRQHYQAFDAFIPADFSSATFFLCAGTLLDANVTLRGLDFSDSQPDKAVVDYLKQMGADIQVESNGVSIKGGMLRGTTIDMNRTPDALPAMAVTAVFAEGTTHLINVPQARNKETDRIACMASELKKLGAAVQELTDGLIIHGGKTLRPTQLNGWGDHRIVMALSLAGMAMDGTTIIDTAEAIHVTFPEYVNLMQALGAKMEVRGKS